jgi:Lamin Tail Domain
MKLYRFFLFPVILFCSSAISQTRYDIVIDEIMADPSPQVGLPNTEWIELLNTSSSPINLQGWRIGDPAGLSGAIPNFILQPDSFVIICANSGVSEMSSFGTTLSVTAFPPLGNDGDEIFLKASNGYIVHAINYSSSWYHNELKKAGGWSLEMIDPENPCTGNSNWKASLEFSGGTPGRKNSVDGSNADNTSPILERTYSIDSATIVAVFNEPIDSLKGATIANYSIDGGLIISSAITLSPIFDMVQLKLISPMQADHVYHLKVNNVTDCKGNVIGFKNEAMAGMTSVASKSEVVVNEILFNPRVNAYDYVEFYNRSHKTFDANKLFAANRNSDGIIGSIRQLSAKPFNIFPGDYVVITEDADNIQLNYLVKDPGKILILPILPSYPDDKGDVILLNMQGEIIDEVKYNRDWHFKLISDDEGISLERLDPGASSQDAANWHSAASTAGYGTPTYQNSQFRNLQTSNASFEITPPIFSPDNDGRDDIATIQYQVGEPGYVANISIFDATGRPVRLLVKNELLGLKGYWNWDGLGEKATKLPVGVYVIFTEIFNLHGKKERFKNSIILAKHL